MEAPNSSSKTLALVRTWRTREGGRKGGKAEEVEREREGGRECCCCCMDEAEEEEEEAVEVGREEEGRRGAAGGLGDDVSDVIEPEQSFFELVRFEEGAGRGRGGRCLWQGWWRCGGRRRQRGGPEGGRGREGEQKISH